MRARSATWRLRCGVVTELRTPPINDGDLFSTRVREYAYEKPLHPLSILAAGCGRSGELDLGSTERVITGVDLDEPDLSTHTRTRQDLDAWHLGDLRTVPMPPRVYDIVHADHLIERVPHAELVLDRFVAALKPGGLLLIRFHDRDTAFGRLDRLTPAWLRTILWRDAAVPPPPAVYEPIASRQGMRGYCVMRGLVITEEYTARDTMTGLGRWSGPAAALCRLLGNLTRDRLTAAHNEVTLVIRKPENRFARVI